MSTSAPSPATATWLGRLRQKNWVLVATLVVGLLVGFLAGWLLSREGEPAANEAVHRGMIDSVDPGSGSVCVSAAGDIECYQAPGLGLTVGRQVRFKTEAQPVDPTDPSKGTQEAIIWVLPD